MDTCKACAVALPGEYFRVQGEMVCSACATRVQSKETADKWKHYWRGTGFGLVAALIGIPVLWGIYGLASFAGNSLFSAGAFLRGTALLMMGGFLGSALRSGSKQRGSLLLQWTGVVLMYASYCVVLALTLISSVPSDKVTPQFLLGAALICPALPLILVAKSFVAISGLIVLVLACSAVWKVNGDTIDISGPFSNAQEAVPMPAGGLFRTLI